MSDQPSPAIQEIVFPNGNHASMVVVPADADAAMVLSALNLKPQAVIVMVGGARGLDQLADETLKSHLVQLFGRGVARAAAEAGAISIDGGTASGAMAMLGLGVAAQGYKSPLLGVAPGGRVTWPGGPAEGSIENSAPLDPNHSHFVLVQSDTWGGESKTLFAIAKELADQEIPIVTLVVNGGEIAKSDLLRCVRNRWPIIVVQGSGRLADEIATLWQDRRAFKGKPPFIPDPVMAEIIADGNIRLFQVDETPEALRQAINWYLGIHTTLALGWGRFALYDDNSKRYQKEFRQLQKWILILGVATTALALALTQFRVQLDGLVWTVPILIWSKTFTLYDLLRLPVIALPIATSALLALSNRFNPGSKYFLLRAAAERVKRELYSYRAHAEMYSDEKLKEANVSRDSLLQQRVEAVGHDLLQTDVKDSALHPYTGPLPPTMYGAATPDDGFSDLSGERYDEVRLEDQITFHRLKMGRLSAELKRYQRLIYAVGGLGTFLAAVGLELWIALTAALATASATYLQYSQVEYTMTRNNQTLLELQNIRAWWRALSAKGRIEPKNIDDLVETTEKLLADENAGWVGQMSQAIAELRAKQAEKEKDQ